MMDEKEYVERGGAECPFCYSDSIETGSKSFETTMLFWSMTCLTCGKTWDDRYELVGYESVEDVASDDIKSDIKSVLKYMGYDISDGVKIFLDDVRDCPPDFICCRTVEEALEVIKTKGVDFISFDHDLGQDKTGYDLANEIEKMVFEGKLDCPGWQVHSSNSPGRDNINRAMKSALKIETQKRQSYGKTSGRTRKTPKQNG